MFVDDGGRAFVGRRPISRRPPLSSTASWSDSFHVRGHAKIIARPRRRARAPPGQARALFKAPREHKQLSVPRSSHGMSAGSLAAWP